MTMQSNKCFGGPAVMKKRILCLSIIVVAVLLIMIGVRTIWTSAKQEPAPAPERICFEVYVVHSNDTLWSISEKNASRLKMNTRDYVNEIKKTNGMSSDRIIAGGKLILPYGIYE